MIRIPGDERTIEATPKESTGLQRGLGLTGLAATGICSMLGAGINVVPFMIQRNVPGIGPNVLPAFLVAAIPALLAAMAYAVLASAMPRAGGSYVYASRGLHPYVGFVASFSQWFGLSIAIGVVSYVTIPFLRDVATALSFDEIASALDTGPIRVGLALALLWGAIYINIRGLRLYERVLIPLMALMFVLGAIVIVSGFAFDHQDFAAGLLAQEGIAWTPPPDAKFQWWTFVAATAILFSSFIGFDSIAQAGGEARNPSRNLPLAIGIAIFTVGSFYMLFTAAVYHAIPWSFIAERAQTQDLTAPGLLGYVLSPSWTVLIVFGAAIALINDLPAMLLAVSRLMFAWAEDAIFPRSVARIHPSHHTPHIALVASGLLATVSILGSHLAGDFFLGVDMLVTSMLFNFLVMCLAVIRLPARNPEIAARISVFSRRSVHLPLAVVGALSLATLLGIHIWKDIIAEVDAWYFHSTPVWLLVMTAGSAIFAWEWMKLRRSGTEPSTIFESLPPE